MSALSSGFNGKIDNVSAKRVLTGVTNYYNNFNDYVLTATGTVGSINGEANMTFDGSILYVTGDITNTGNIYSYGNITAEGEVTAYYSSDEKLKTNINDFNEALDIIEKLNPKIYNWNERAKELCRCKDDRLHYGLIAQDLEKILPELIHPIYTEFKSIDYIQLIPILIQAIKELNEKIKKLENK
jgi:hypothetical protein